MYRSTMSCSYDNADGRNCKTMIGAVDYFWLFTYVVFMIGRYIKSSNILLACVLCAWTS